MRGKRLIGITGGIGAGKSVVSRILRHRGYPVYDCDSEAKRLMDTDAEVISGLKSLLGDSIYSADGKLDRGEMSRRLFSDDEIRRGVNGIVHSAVRRDLMRWTGMQQRYPAFVESAILSTSRLDEDCDEVWLVDAPEDVRIRRVKERNGLEEGAIRRRIASQSQEFCQLPKERLSVLDNGGEVSLLRQIDSLLEKYK